MIVEIFQRFKKLPNEVFKDSGKSGEMLDATRIFMVHYDPPGSVKGLLSHRFHLIC